MSEPFESLTFTGMKIIKTLGFVAFLLLASCTRQSDHADAGQDTFSEENPNQALYDQVMDVHDEVMPKMDEIMKLKRMLQQQITDSPDLVAERKEQLERVISNLDSASNAMMDWMHHFNPLPDSVDQEKAREYLESEMEQIKKVKTQMLEAIEKGKEANSKSGS